MSQHGKKLVMKIHSILRIGKNQYALHKYLVQCPRCLVQIEGVNQHERTLYRPGETSQKFRLTYEYSTTILI